MLKYQRLGASVPELLSSDVASCMCASDKLLALGTKSGRVHILDFNGNEIKRFSPHAAPVNDICFDARGEFTASCADDGTVAINGLYSDEQLLHEYSAAVKTVAIDPDFAVKKSRQFVCGGLNQQLVLNGKGWMGHRTDSILHAGEGTVQVVRWAGSIIAWANDVGVKMYDKARNQRIAFIDRPPGSPPPDLYRPNLVWDWGDKVLIVGWADCVKVARVGTHDAGEKSAPALAGVPTFGRSSAAGPTSSSGLGSTLGGKLGNIGTKLGGLAGGLGGGGASGGKGVGGGRGKGGGREGDEDEGTSGSVSRYVEIVAMFQTNYFISGIAPFGDALVIFAFVPDAEVAEARGTGGELSRAHAKDDTQRLPSQRPEVHVVSWANEDLTCDALGIKGFEAYQANDYRLVALLPHRDRGGVGVDGGGDGASGRENGKGPGGGPAGTRQCHWWKMGDEPLYYLVSPQDVVLGRPRSVDDHLEWLVQRGDFEGALEACEAAESAGMLVLGGGTTGESVGVTITSGSGTTGEGTSSVLDKIAAKYLDRLLSDGEAEKAAALCPRLLRGSAAAWERWVFHFAHLRQLRCLAPYIPTESPVLKDTVYEVVLNAFLANAADHARFLATVKAWPSRLYSIPGLISAVRQRIAAGGGAMSHGGTAGGGVNVESPVLKEALAELYLADGQRERALALHLELGRPAVLDFIARHGLFMAVLDKIPMLTALDPSRAVTLLVDQREAVPVDTVVEQLKAAAEKGGRAARETLHLYLRRLYEVDSFEGETHHGLQIPLYIEFHPAELMQFLQHSVGYDLNEALKECESHGMTREQVYLLGRMGGSRKALEIIVMELGDVAQAIAFVQEHGAGEGDELWDQLIALAVDKPGCVRDLLDNLGSLFDPRRVLSRIPSGLAVEGLRDRLVAILGDSRGTEKLWTGCHAVIRRDVADLSRRRFKEARRAYRPGKVIIVEDND